MAESNPSIVSASIPTEARPNDRFTFDVTVRQGGPDPWASEDACVKSILDVWGWKTPVALEVDGEEADRKKLCLLSGNTGTATLSASLSEGTHTLNVVVYQVGGNAYDLETTPNEPNDDVSQTVSVTTDATDPSRPTTANRISEWFREIADALGGTTQQIAFGMVLAVVLLMVI
jgi:hypothetical protein